MSIVLPISPKPEAKAPEGRHADGFDGDDNVDHQANTCSEEEQSRIPAVTIDRQVRTSSRLDQTIPAATIDRQVRTSSRLDQTIPAATSDRQVRTSSRLDQTNDASNTNHKGKEIWSLPQNGHPVIEEGATVYIPNVDTNSTSPTTSELERLLELGSIPVVAHMYEDMAARLGNVESPEHIVQQNVGMREASISNPGARTSSRMYSTEEQESGGGPDVSETGLKRKSEDIEVSVVNRLEGTGMQSYRQELYRDQVRRQSLHVSCTTPPSRVTGDSLHMVRRKSSGDVMPLKHRPRKPKTGKRSHIGLEQTGGSLSPAGSLSTVSVRTHIQEASRDARYEQSRAHTQPNRYFSMVSGTILNPPILELESKQDENHMRSSTSRVETSSRSPTKTRGTPKDKEHGARRDKTDRVFLMAKQTLTDTILLTDTDKLVDEGNTRMQSVVSNVADKDDVSRNICIVKTTADSSPGTHAESRGSSPGTHAESRGSESEHHQSAGVKECMDTSVPCLSVDEDESHEERTTVPDPVQREKIHTSVTDGSSPGQLRSLASRLLPLCNVIVHILSRAELPYYV